MTIDMKFQAVQTFFGDGGEIILRPPETKDGTSFHELAKASGTLDVNSLYHYLILCRHFGQTCVAAEHQGKVAGFVTAYLPPSLPDTIFVWQVAVDETMRGRGLGRAMLASLQQRVRPLGVKYMDATITPSNQASVRLFTSVAKHLNAPFAFGETVFSAADFGKTRHEPELLFHIGPIFGLVPANI